MGEAWEQSYELVIHNLQHIILPCAQILGQYVARNEIPSEGRWGVVTVGGCELGDVSGGVKSPVIGEE